MADQPTAGADTPKGPGDTGAESASGSGADAPAATNAATVDAGGGDDWKAKFEEAKKDRDKLKEQAREFESFKSKMAEAMGFAPVKSDDDPKVVIKNLQDQIAAEAAARTELEKRLAREQVLRGVVETDKALVALAGLEATGAVDLTNTDPSTVREKLKESFPGLFETAEASPKPSPKIPAPKNGTPEGPKWANSVIKRGVRVL